MTKIKQAHNHDPAQQAMFNQTSAVARRSDPETSTAAAASVTSLRASHIFVLQLFRGYGPMTDEQAWTAYRKIRAQGESVAPRMSPSGLRSRRAELCPPRGVGIRDSGRRVQTGSGRLAVVWEIAE